MSRLILLEGKNTVQQKDKKEKKMDVTVCVCTTVPMLRKERRRRKKFGFVCLCSDDAENQYAQHTLIYCLKLGFCCCLSCLV